tara:strand:+ start:119 stop:1210 length:1092 start_codon:yes stop_codon:yes gene_type:complete
VIFDQNLKKSLDYFLYKRIHLILYIFFGILSVGAELLIRNFFINIGLSIYFTDYFSVLIGIFLMFVLNATFNFNIPKHLFFKSFLYFFIISVLSIFLQNQLNINHSLLFEIPKFVNIDDSYNINKIFLMTLLFILAYSIHRKLSFKDEKKVGVAIYANGHEDIELIYNKIGPYPDFIHVDIVDKTLNPNANDIQSYKLEVIKAYWPNHKIETHIMSTKPSTIIPLVAKFSDIVYFHIENHENSKDLINQILSFNTTPGIAIHYKSNIFLNDQIFKLAKNFLILAIDEIGISGQNFNNKAFDKIKTLNSLEKNTNYNLCVDGGVNLTNIDKINAKKVVSGSNILNNNNSKKQIMKLKTVARYAK